MLSTICSRQSSYSINVSGSVACLQKKKIVRNPAGDDGMAELDDGFTSIRGQNRALRLILPT